jgi:hypothetical protein
MDGKPNEHKGKQLQATRRVVGAPQTAQNAEASFDDLDRGSAVQICKIAFVRPRLSHVLLHPLSFFCAVRFFSLLCSKEAHAKILLFHPPTQASITPKNFF